MTLHIGRDVGVSIHLVGYLRVSKDFLYDFRILPLFKYLGSKGVSGIVKADALRRQSSLLEKQLEVAFDQVIPAHRSALLRRENQIVITPQTRILEPTFSLALPVALGSLHRSLDRAAREPLREGGDPLQKAYRCLIASTYITRHYWGNL